MCKLLFIILRFYRWLRTKPVILLLNKQDLLAEKIKNGSRIEDYFWKRYEELISLVEPGKKIIIYEQVPLFSFYQTVNAIISCYINECFA